MQRPPPLSPPVASAPVLLYSYGALMAPSALTKRSVAPLRSAPASLADCNTCLAFAHRGGYATLLSSPPASGAAYRAPPGVLHTLHSPADLQRLAANEVGYRLTTLQVTPCDGPPVAAAVFLSSPLLVLRAPAPPRRRYRDLLLEGCTHHGLGQLDPEYVAWLEGLQVRRSAGSAATSPQQSREPGRANVWRCNAKQHAAACILL